MGESLFLVRLGIADGSLARLADEELLIKMGKEALVRAHGQTRVHVGDVVAVFVFVALRDDVLGAVEVCDNIVVVCERKSARDRVLNNVERVVAVSRDALDLVFDDRGVARARDVKSRALGQRDHLVLSIANDDIARDSAIGYLSVIRSGGDCRAVTLDYRITDEKAFSGVVNNTVFSVFDSCFKNRHVICPDLNLAIDVAACDRSSVRTFIYE